MQYQMRLKSDIIFLTIGVIPNSVERIIVNLDDVIENEGCQMHFVLARDFQSEGILGS